MESILILILLLSPLAGFLFNVTFGKKVAKHVPGCLSSTMVLISFVVSVYFFLQVLTTGQPIEAHMFYWMKLETFSVDFGFRLDQLSLLWLLFVTGIGFLIHVYSIGYMKGDRHIDRFFAYMNLFIFFMIILVSGSNLLMMFIGWEGVGLCSYLLIGFWFSNHQYNNAAKKAFIMNRIGDLGFLIGLIILAYLFNTIDFVELQGKVTTLSSANIGLLSLATLMLFLGAVGKSAQIPLYTWLPDAMAGPTPVSALIHAATMVTAGVFMVVRMNFAFSETPDVMMVIAVVGALTALLGATIGMKQNDIKKVLAYSTISQLGLMFLAVGLGAYQVAVFHVITHAFFKACLFLGSGSVIHAMDGEQDMRKMGGLKGVMGATWLTFFISTLAISGIPPFSGFFSKDEIMLVAYEKQPILWILAAVASLMTAFYMFRVLFLTFFGEFRGTKAQKEHLHESPKVMTSPLWILAVLAIVGGLISLPGHSWLNSFLTPVLPQLAQESHDFTFNAGLMMVISTLIAVAGIFLAYRKYIIKKVVPAEDGELTGFAKIVYNKFYIDEIYDKVFVQSTYSIAAFFSNIFNEMVRGLINSGGALATWLSTPFSRLQNGNVSFYLFFLVLGFCSIVAFVFFV